MRKLTIAAFLSLFFCGTGLAGCVVLKSSETAKVSCKTYRVTVMLLPGYDPSVMGDSRITFQAPAFKMRIADTPETLSFTIKVTDEAALREFCSALDVAGIAVKEIEIQNY